MLTEPYLAPQAGVVQKDDRDKYPPTELDVLIARRLTGSLYVLERDRPRFLSRPVITQAIQLWLGEARPETLKKWEAYLVNQEKSRFARQLPETLERVRGFRRDLTADQIEVLRVLIATTAANSALQGFAQATRSDRSLPVTQEKADALGRFMGAQVSKYLERLPEELIRRWFDDATEILHTI